MPWLLRRSAVLTELATVPLIRCLIFASSSMKKFAVEPEPTPITASSTMYLIASRATACFCSSCVIARLERESSIRLSRGASFLARGRQIGAHTLEELRAEPDRLAQCRMRMDRTPDVDGVGAHLDRERDLADQVPGVRAD